MKGDGFNLPCIVTWDSSRRKPIRKIRIESLWYNGLNHGKHLAWREAEIPFSPKLQTLGIPPTPSPVFDNLTSSPGPIIRLISG